jgi:superfamily II DNA/RNA helicase
VNYQCPEDEKTYLHRIGRTGRAGATGIAVTFVDWDDLHRWAMIDRTLDLGIPDPVETYSTSPHLYSELGIPAGTKGTLPRSARTRAGLDAEVVEDLGETGHRGGSGSREASRDDRGPRGGRGSGPRDAEAPPRQRQRTRGGEDGGTRGARASTAPAPATSGGGTGGTGGTTVPVSGGAPGADAGEGTAPRRRRRRGGRGRGGADAASTVTAAEPSA